MKELIEPQKGGFVWSKPRKPDMMPDRTDTQQQKSGQNYHILLKKYTEVAWLSYFENNKGRFHIHTAFIKFKHGNNRVSAVSNLRYNECNKVKNGCFGKAGDRI